MEWLKKTLKRVNWAAWVAFVAILCLLFALYRQNLRHVARLSDDLLSGFAFYLESFYLHYRDGEADDLERAHESLQDIAAQLDILNELYLSGVKLVDGNGSVSFESLSRYYFEAGMSADDALMEQARLALAPTVHQARVLSLNIGQILTERASSLNRVIEKVNVELLYFFDSISLNYDF